MLFLGSLHGWDVTYLPVNSNGLINVEAGPDHSSPFQLNSSYPNLIPQRCLIPRLESIQLNKLNTSKLSSGGHPGVGGPWVRELKAAIRPDTAIVSVMAVNNEIGVVQPLKVGHRRYCSK